jgi:predicted transcriptional regulator
MERLNRSKFLHFLSKPRYAHEVANHFDISGKLVNYHLKEWVKSGKVLISEKRVSRSFLGLKGERKNMGGFLYVSRDSPLIAGGSLQLIGKKDEKFTLTAATEGVPVKFVSKVGGLRDKNLHKDQMSAFTDRNADSSRIAPVHLESKVNLDSPVLDILAIKGRLTERRVGNQPIERKMKLGQSSYKPLSHVERIRLFQAMSDQPLSFLDLHARFGVSKQTIRRLVKNGLLIEEWGPQAIGVRFKLSKRGKLYLKELEAAAKYESKIAKKDLIRFNRRACF